MANVTELVKAMTQLATDNCTVLLLDDGVYELPETLKIETCLTIRAMHAGQATLDGGSSHRVLEVVGDKAVAVLDGLQITNGQDSHVSSCT